MFQPRSKPILFCDTETWSELDIKTCGTVKYCQSAEMILAGFLLEDTYHVYDYCYNPVIPDWVTEHIDSGGLVCAHNALFDFIVLRKYFPNLKIEQMIDSMAIAAAHGLPQALGKVTPALHLSVQKYTDGGKLVRRFCIPRKPSKNDDRTRILPKEDPKGWEEFRDVYLHLDIYSMRELIDKLGVLTEKEQAYWVDTQRINLLGVPLDLPTSKLIQSKVANLVDEESSKFIRLTGLFPTQRDRVLGWVREQGVKVLNLQAATVAEILDDPKTPLVVAQALEARANTTHMSFKKYDAFINAACEDDTAKGTLTYHAAHTGRFGGRLIQTQNLTKGTIETNEAVQLIQDGEFSIDLVKSSVRGMIHWPEGMSICDWSGVEARGVQWIAKDKDALQVFVDGKDPYIWMASQIYGVDEEDVTPKQRFTGKQAILGLGYQMSWKKFIEMVEGYGETISIDEAKVAVVIYRKVHKKLVALWANINDAAIMALSRPGRNIKVNQYISFINREDFLYMYLPSGRSIAYFEPVMEENNWGGMTFSYMSMNDKNQYVRTRTYGGKLTENAVQGICRDILVEAVHKLVKAGYTPITHVHDEIVVRGDIIEYLESVMTEVPEWAEGFPIDVEGFVSPRFKKG